jgi:PKD repeat protein
MQSLLKLRLSSFSLLLILLFSINISSIFAQPVIGPSASFDYSMQDRFGLDKNGDGLVDYGYSYQYVNPSSGYEVNFDGCRSLAGQGRIVYFAWNVEGNGVSTNRSEDSCKTTQPINLPEGIYSVTLTVTNENGQTDRITERIAVKDLLLVSIGDSLGSGEGNPDNAQPTWEDKRCHRSASAYSAKAALDIETADPHTSVTFLHLACSGAEIVEGLIDWYDGIEPPTGHDPHELIQPQTWQITRAICRIATSSNDPTCLNDGRNVDMLMINVGINDIGFSDIVTACADPTHVPCDTDRGVNSNLNAGFAKLLVLYKQLADDIAKRFRVSNIMITEYPDPTHDTDGSFCTTFGGALSGITESEAKWASEKVVSRLNKLIQDTANTQGWIFASGIAEKFRTHGYCTPDNFRWFRTMEDSRVIQKDLSGTLHPNVHGHQIAYKESVVPLIQSFSAPPQLIATITPNSIKSKVPTTFNVHAEDSKNHKPVEGVVIINNKQVGVTDTPFTYTYDASVSRLGIVKVTSLSYPDKHLHLSIEMGEPITKAEPSTISLSKETSVTIYATDPITGEDVAGKVLTDEDTSSNSTIGETNKPFIHTFTKKVIVETDDEGNRRLVRVNPTVSVVAPGYETTNVRITFTGGF